MFFLALLGRIQRVLLCPRPGGARRAPCLVERVGDAYRWRGESVSIAKVAEFALFTVHGVGVPVAAPPAGLAALVCAADFRARGFPRTASELLRHAQPWLLRAPSRAAARAVRTRCDLPTWRAPRITNGLRGLRSSHSATRVLSPRSRSVSRSVSHT